MQGGAVHSHQLFPLLTGPVRHEDVDGMAGEGTQSGEGDAGVAAGHLHDGLAGLQGAVGGGLGDNVGRQTILDAAREVVGLQLRPDEALPAVQLVANADHGGVPYQMCEVHNCVLLINIIHVESSHLWETRPGKTKGAMCACTSLLKALHARHRHTETDACICHQQFSRPMSYNNRFLQIHFS